MVQDGIGMDFFHGIPLCDAVQFYAALHAVQTPMAGLRNTPRRNRIQPHHVP
jgi:hypothetical protein